MRLLPIFLALLSTRGILANYNVTIDDDDAAIRYLGANWENGSKHFSSLDHGTGHSVSTDAGATATLTFTGVAVYYFSPLWPYSVSVNIALDSGSPTFVSLLDPAYIGHENTAGGKETVMSDIRWSVSGLPNGTHTVVISVPGGGGFVIVDGFTYTAVDAVTVAPAPSPAHITTTSPAPTAQAPSSTSELTLTDSPTTFVATPASATTNSAVSTHVASSGNTVPIAAGVGAGVGALLVCLAAFLLCRRRKRRDRRVDAVPWGAGFHDKPGPSHPGTKQLGPASLAVSRPRALVRPSEHSRTSNMDSSHPSGSSSHYKPWHLAPASTTHYNSARNLKSGSSPFSHHPSGSTLSASSGAASSSSPSTSQYDSFAGAYHQAKPLASAASPFANVPEQSHNSSVSEKQVLAFNQYSPPKQEPPQEYPYSIHPISGHYTQSEGSRYTQHQPKQANLNAEAKLDPSSPQSPSSPPAYTRS